MKFERIVSGMMVAMFAAAGLVLSGCSMEVGDGSGFGTPEDEDVGQAADAIGAECADAPATAVFRGTINYLSPRGYTTPSCYKAVVVDVNQLLPDYLMWANWIDDPPTTKAECEDIWLRAEVRLGRYPKPKRCHPSRIWGGWLARSTFTRLFESC